MAFGQLFLFPFIPGAPAPASGMRKHQLLAMGFSGNDPWRGSRMDCIGCRPGKTGSGLYNPLPLQPKTDTGHPSACKGSSSWNHSLCGRPWMPWRRSSRPLQKCPLPYHIIQRGRRENISRISEKFFQTTTKSHSPRKSGWSADRMCDFSRLDSDNASCFRSVFQNRQTFYSNGNIPGMSHGMLLLYKL